VDRWDFDILKLGMKKFKFIYLLVPAIFIIILYFVRIILPSQKPWSSYEGKICDYSGCHTSEIEQQNQYWIDQAIKKKNINLCDNSLGFFVGGRPKEQSIYLCKAAYAVGVGNLEYCRNLDKEAPYVNCRQQFATKYHQPEICDEIKTPNYENLNQSVVDSCKKDATR